MHVLDMSAERDPNVYHHRLATTILVNVKPAGKDDIARKVNTIYLQILVNMYLLYHYYL